ncbi:MAG: hypothetical protein AAF678_01670 [Pseudomonadota bacterium]
MPETLKGRVSVEMQGSNSVTIEIDPENGNIELGGQGTDGDVWLNDGNDTRRVRLNADGQRAEFLNAAGEIIAMMGGGGNLRAGSNGTDGDLFLYDRSNRNIFSTSDYRIFLSARDGSLTIRNANGDDVVMLGRNGNIRMGGNGSDGDILLFPSRATDIYRSSQATIHLDADAGDITLRNADCAEDFAIDAPEPVAPGTVMSLAGDGKLVPSSVAFDRKVVGVVSGAGEFRPGIVLDRRDASEVIRQPIALLGKVMVNVTGEGGRIEVGDLLTSGYTPGTAMSAKDASQMIGATLGKAMAVHRSGEGQIPVLVALQ